MDRPFRTADKRGFTLILAGYERSGLTQAAFCHPTVWLCTPSATNCGGIGQSEKRQKKTPPRRNCSNRTRLEAFPSRFIARANRQAKSSPRFPHRSHCHDDCIQRRPSHLHRHRSHRHACLSADRRKSFNGLYGIVREQLRQDPLVYSQIPAWTNSSSGEDVR
jgi:hypothetical protein